MNTKTLTVILIISLFGLIKGFGLDCDTVSHSCTTCIDFGCHWCQAETNELSFCTKKSNLCTRGSLLEDNIFCPKIDSNFESLEWWGENAFFSRSSSCSSFGDSCIHCISQADLECGWCLNAGSPVCTEVTDALCPGLNVGCLVTPLTETTIDEDEVATLDVNPLFYTSAETNTTDEQPTSDLYSITASVLSGDCTRVVSGDEVILTPGANFNGDCEVEITATALTPTQAATTRLSSTWVVTFSPVNDPPVAISDYSSILDSLNPIAAGDEYEFDACEIFSDADQTSFDITFTNINPDTDISDVSCDCYSSPFECMISVVAEDFPSSADSIMVTMTATDSSSESASIEFEVRVASENHAPTLENPIVSFDVDEDDETAELDLSNVFDDIEDSESLEITISESINSLASSSYDSESMILTLTIDGKRTGSVNVIVTATDSGSLSVSDTFLFTINPINDAPEIYASVQDSYSQDAGTTSTVTLSDFIQDEDSFFDDGSLVCDTTNQTEVNISFEEDIMTIHYLFPTESDLTFTIICSDDDGEEVPFDIIVGVTLENSDPEVLQKFTTLESMPSETSSIDLTLFFTDDDIVYGDSLTFSATSSDSSAVTVNVDGDELEITLSADSRGTYTVTVSAQDESGRSVSQTLTVLSYVRPQCQGGISTNWASSSALTLNLTSLCPSSNSFTVTFTENVLDNSLADVVTPVVSGNQITFSSSDACRSGKYYGNAILDDGKTISTVRIELIVTSPSSTVTALRNSSSIAVVKTSGTSQGYDAEVRLTGVNVLVDLRSLVVVCGAPIGNIRFEVVSSTFAFLQNTATNNDGLITAVNGPNMMIKGVQNGNIVRQWTVSAVIKASDTKGSSTTFYVTVVKNWNY